MDTAVWSVVDQELDKLDAVTHPTAVGHAPRPDAYASSSVISRKRLFEDRFIQAEIGNKIL